MKGRMNRTWSLDNIKVKDNFYDYVMMMCRHVEPSSQLKGSLSLLVKALHHPGQIQGNRNDKRTDLFWEVFVENIFVTEAFIKDCSRERELNCGTKLYSIVRLVKRGRRI